jgi:cell wall-associated NlpC family hydrolase
MLPRVDRSYPRLASRGGLLSSAAMRPRHTLLLALSLCASAHLHAEPQAQAQTQVQAPTQAQKPPEKQSGDAVLQMLHDKGLFPSAEQIAAQTSPLVEQVRDAASDLVLSAMNFLGVRYRRGGTTAEQGFDCSGFTRYVFENSLGLVLPRRADEQARTAALLAVKKEELRPGDLVFFNTMRRAFSHVGIYVGEGKFIHAPRPGGEVRIEDMRQAYWARRFNGGRRADLPAPETPQ